MRKKTAALLLAIIMLFCSIPVFAEGEGAEPSVIDCPDAETVSAVAEREIDNFNSPVVNWAGTGLTALQNTDEPPYSAFEGTRMLRIRSRENEKEVTLDYNETVTERYMGLSVFGSSDATVKITLNGSNFVYEAETAVKGGEWRYVMFDLADEASVIKKAKNDQRKIGKVMLSFVGAETVYIDSVCVFGDFAPDIVRFMTDSIASEGAAAFIDGEMHITVIGEYDHYIQFTPVIADYGSGKGIAVTFTTGAKPNTMTLKYTSDDNPKVWKEITRSVPDSTEKKTVVFPMPEVKVGKIRIYFEGNDGEEYTLSSVRVSPCAKINGNVGTVTECLYNKDGNSITFGLSDIEEYNDCEAYLFALDGGENSAELGSRVAFAKTTVTDGKAYFEGAADETAVYKKYAAAVMYEGKLVSVGKTSYVTNPGAASAGKCQFDHVSAKGSAYLPPDYVKGGIYYSALDIELPRLLSVKEGEKAGKYYLSEEYVAYLDGEFEKLQRQNILVYGVIKLKKTNDISLDSIIFDDNGNILDYSILYNSVLACVTEWLCDRYGSQNGLTANMCGIGIAGGERNDLPLSEYAEKYAVLFRSVYTAAKKINGNTEVFICPSGSWDKKSIVSESGGFGWRELITALTDRINDEGKADFTVAYDIWNNVGIRYSSVGEIISFTDGTDAVSGKNIILLGTERKETDENEKIKNTSEYIYMCLEADYGRYGRIKAVIPSVDTDYCDALLYCGSDITSEKLSFAAELINQSRLRDLFTLAEENPKLYITEKALADVIPSAVNGTILWQSFESGKEGFFASDGCYELTEGITIGNEKGILSAKLKSGTGEMCGIAQNVRTSGLDETDYLGIKVRTAEYAKSGSTVYLILSGEKTRAIYSSEIGSDNFAMLIADLNSIRNREKITDIEIYVDNKNGEDGILLLSELRLYSLIMNDRELEKYTQNKEKTVKLKNMMIAGGAAAALIVVEIIRIAVKKYRPDGEDDGYEE